MITMMTFFMVTNTTTYITITFTNSTIDWLMGSEFGSGLRRQCEQKVALNVADKTRSVAVQI